ncbi:MAG: MFS transporter [bacterium]
MFWNVNLSIAERLGRRVYYGWVIVGVMFSANLSAFVFGTIFGLFFTPLEAEFGWGRSQISVAPLFGTVLASVLAPMFGYLTDRYGSRWLMMVLGLISAVGHLLLSRIDAVWQFNILIGIVYAFPVTGIAWMMSSVNINRWFSRRRGRAMGIVMMGASASAMIFVPVVTFTIAVIGWRNSYAMLGAVNVLLIVLPVFLLAVDLPEQLGLGGHPELKSTPRAGGGAISHLDADWSLGQAARTHTFWIVLTAIVLGNFAVQGYFIHAFPHMESLGFSRLNASAVWGTFFFVGVIAKFCWGFIIERIGVRTALVILFVGEASGLYLLNSAGSLTALYFYAAFNGLAHGPFLQLLAMIWADYFGKKAIGRIYGTVQPAILISGSLGAWSGGIFFDHGGDYHLFFNIGIALCLTSAFLFLIAPPPAPPSAPPAASVAPRTPQGAPGREADVT